MPPPSPRFSNRIAAVIEHIPRYTIQGQARLARDAGVSRSAVSRLLSGQTVPSFTIALALTNALERELGKKLEPRELLSLDGTYPTPNVCDLCGCRGCLPRHAYAPDDTLHPDFRSIAPGTWSLAPSSIEARTPDSLSPPDAER